MRIHSSILFLGVLTLLPGLVWPAGAVKKSKAARSPVASTTGIKKSQPTKKLSAILPALPDSSFQQTQASPSRDRREVNSDIDPDSDPFGDFLRKGRVSEDSLQFLLGEQTFQRKHIDSALSHHLAANVPGSGEFRDTLLAQRARIFAQVWPAAGPITGNKVTVAKEGPSKDTLSIDSVSNTSKPVFAWGMGSSHSRGVYRMGAWQPDGWRGMGFEEQYWTYNTFARQSWPFSFRGKAMNLAANVNQSTAGEFSTLDASLEALVRDGFLADLALVLSGGRRKSLEWGAYQSYDLMVSKGWYFGNVGMGLYAGFSREWNGEGKRMNDNAWITLHRDIRFEDESSLGISLSGAFDSRDPQSDWITASVLYVDDVSKARPTHFRAQDFRDTVSGNNGVGLDQFLQHAGALQLATSTPRSYFSLSPAFQYSFSLPARFGGMAGASYALDFYRESTWDWVPMPDSLNLSGADMVGLAFNRADGRYYAVALSEENGEVRESYGASPMQHRKATRLDQKVGLNMSVWRPLPHGYTLALESSAGFGWTNLSGTSPIGSQPWHWGLSFNLSRTSGW